MFAAPLRPLRRKERLAPEGKSGCGAFVDEHLRASPDGKAEARGVQTFLDVVLPPPARRNEESSETPQETLPSKGVDRDDHVPRGGQPHTESEEASWPEKGSSSPEKTFPHSVPPSTVETESIGLGTPFYDPTSVPIIRRIGGPPGPRRSPSRSSSNNGNSDVARPECSLHFPAGFQASGAQAETPAVIFWTGGEHTSEKIPGGLSPPMPKPRAKKSLSGSFPDAFPPTEVGAQQSEQNGSLGAPLPLPRTKKRLSGAFSDSAPSPEASGVLLQGELSSLSELEKQVLAAMTEEVSESWTSGTWTGVAQDDWLHVAGGEDKETKEEELEFGFVSVGGPADSGRVQR